MSCDCYRPPDYWHRLERALAAQWTADQLDLGRVSWARRVAAKLALVWRCVAVAVAA